MSTSAIGNQSSSYLQQLLASVLQTSGITANTTAGPSAASSTNGSSQSQSDSTQLSQFAQLVNTLDQLQQSDPTQYKQVTAQIATNLQSAAETAQSQGNSSATSQLTQLASDFTTASQNGQLPNLQDLAQAFGGGTSQTSGSGHHHHHHAEAASSDSASSSSTASSSTSGSTSQSLSQFLASLFQTSGTEDTQGASSINPETIIAQTLASAGISASSS